MSASFNWLINIASREEVHAQIHWVYRGNPGSRGPGWSGFSETPFSVFFVESGCVEMIFEDGRNVCCGTGDLFLGARSVRKQRIAADTKVLSVGYDLTWVTRHPVYDQGLSLHVPVAAFAANAAYRRLRAASLALLRQFYKDRGDIDFVTATHLPPSDAGSSIRQQIAFWAWFSHVQPVFDLHDTRPVFPMARSAIVREVKERVDRYPLSAPFRDLTKGVGLSVSWRRVQQLFQEELHQTPHDYFDSRRMDHACRRLRMHGGNVKEVASEVGFRSLSHFSDWFKKISGRSPRQFLLGP